MGEDLRTYKTNQIIQFAFIQLLREKEFSAITVKNILDRAFIHRKTFYSHYHDKYELADQLIDKALEIVVGTIMSTSDELKTVNYFQLSVERGEELYKNRRLILAVWNLRTDTRDFRALLEEMVEKRYLHYMEAQGKERNSDIVFQSKLFSAVVAASLKNLLERDGPIEPYYAFEQFQEMYGIINEISKK